MIITAGHIVFRSFYEQAGLKLVRALILILSVLTAVSAEAQDGEQKLSASINVTGRVVTELSMQSILVESIYNPSFQQVNIGLAKLVIDPVIDRAGSEGGAGMLVAKGEPNRSFQAVIPEMVTIINSETGSALDVHVWVSHSGIIDQSSSDYIRDAISGFTLNSEGEYYFWLGGEIDIADVEDGEYEGSFMMEIEYL